MMNGTRTKALILGAQPPFEGQFIPIGEARKWQTIVHSMPEDVSGADEAITILVMDDQGNVTPLLPGGDLSGVACKAVVGPCDGVKLVSVHVEVLEH